MAQKAYDAAERLIAQAKAEDWELLDFDTPEFWHLETLPPEIGQLDALRRLDLINTSVSDVRPLRGLTRLTELWLDNSPVKEIEPVSWLWNLVGLSLVNTSVADITPLSKLKGLGFLWLGGSDVRDLNPLSRLTGLEELDLGKTPVTDLRPLLSLHQFLRETNEVGVHFTGCAAAQLDARIDEISKIEVAPERARALFEYLENSDAPSTKRAAPEADDLFQVEEDADGQLEVAASVPEQAEVEDALKRSMHRGLQDILERLARAAGNSFPKLQDVALRLLALVREEFDALDMPMIHLALGELRAALTAGGEEAGEYPDEITVLLEQAMQAGPGLTLNNPVVEELMARADRYARRPDPEDVRATQDAMSDSVAGDARVMGPKLRGMSRQVSHNPDPEAAVAQKAVNRNVLWRFAVWSGGFAGAAVGGKVIGDLLGQPIIDFVTANWPVLEAAARTYGGPFAEWFIASMSRLPEVAAVIASVPDRRP
ncbi:MAG: leucine-rich repeat domain-containing protein [Rhodobacteraceae bacterium]|nr:leucine-rich repeat domain-containing protein [Paracoccaceae bacterium]